MESSCGKAPITKGAGFALAILRERPEIPFDELLRERRNREP